MEWWSVGVWCWIGFTSRLHEGDCVNARVGHGGGFVHGVVGRRGEEGGITGVAAGGWDIGVSGLRTR
jgi:hypothetical protein